MFKNDKIDFSKFDKEIMFTVKKKLKKNMKIPKIIYA